MGVYKDAEFKEFIKEIEEGSIAYWKEIAEALGVEQDTITRWAKMPEAMEARRKGIANALAGMQKAGAKDWRMYEAKLKMLGINPQSKVAVELSDPRKDILKQYMDGGDAGQTPTTEG